MNIDYHTEEFTYRLRPNSVIEISIHKNFDGDLALEKVAKNLQVLDQVIDGKSRALLLYFPNKYIREEI